ncbi:alpha/beta-hydrolase [Basidiobolus meristosporus CBS 931.73]|uniref:Alpha/beta-hydrolase n=1 Tax=Basidiobolus meristosporus CBS 931.73 TaxID=1314790 RepID=A0A1Y1YYT5_9FUNG|nr:alpha/beta-hydrolase [Basidiobolus meristosporus CBS 931.73]|eukprot:ORY03200.1 alpha/beta-hydrolase [Basidiobolus meristosporus CBS 931.73]
MADIYRENLVAWLSWVFFTTSFETLAKDPEIVQELNEMVYLIEAEKGIKFPPGYNPKAKCIRLNIDPVNAIHRPLIFYTCVFAVDFTSKFLLSFLGFRNFTKDESKQASFWSESLEFDLKAEFGGKKYALPYWYYDPAKSWFGLSSRQRSTKAKPIVFIHGIGAGLGCYLMFIWKLIKLGQPVFLVELPYVSMRFIEEAPSMEELGREIEMMLEAHGFNNACFVGHSLGTIVVSWMVNHHSKRVKSAFFIDPICFLLFYPSVAYNFVYRVPKTAREHFLHFYASKELFISNFISRYFVWFHSLLLTDRVSIPKKTFVYLSENDLLVPTKAVAQYLNDTNVHCRVFSGLDHASFLFSPKEENEIVENIRRCVRS